MQIDRNRKPLYDKDFLFYLTKKNAGETYTMEEISEALSKAIKDYKSKE